jgi:hypothetical protein
MPFSIKPTIADMPVVKQDVRLHIWGYLKNGSIDEILGNALRPPFCHPRALQPGGAIIPDIDWGDMPSGLPNILQQYGLGMAWLTQPVGFEPAGSHISHPILGVSYEMRIGPAWTSFDLLRPTCRRREHADRIATCLLDMLPVLGVHKAMSNHQMLTHDPILRAVQNAQSSDDLERVVGSARTRGLIG